MKNGKVFGKINIIDLLVILVVIVAAVAVALKIPAIPGITLGIVAGAVLGVIFQNNCDLGTIFDYGINGFYFSDEILEELSSRRNSGGPLWIISPGFPQ